MGTQGQSGLNKACTKKNSAFCRVTRRCGLVARRQCFAQNQVFEHLLKRTGEVPERDHVLHVFFLGSTNPRILLLVYDRDTVQDRRVANAPFPSDTSLTVQVNHTMRLQTLRYHTDRAASEFFTLASNST